MVTQRHLWLSGGLLAVALLTTLVALAKLLGLV